MHQLLNTICISTYTISDFYRRMGILQSCLEEVLYHSAEYAHMSRAEACRAYIEKNASPEDACALGAWDQSIWDAFQLSNLVEQLAALKHDAELLPVLVLYVPTELDDEALAVLGNWARGNINEHQMLELHVDASVTGGCAFVHNDTYHDYSLRHFLSTQKGVVTELLSSYA